MFGALGTFGQMAGLVSMACAGGAAEWFGIPTVYLVCGAFAMLAGLVLGALVKEPALGASQAPSAV